MLFIWRTWAFLSTNLLWTLPCLGFQIPIYVHRRCLTSWKPEQQLWDTPRSFINSQSHTNNWSEVMLIRYIHTPKTSWTGSVYIMYLHVITTAELLQYYKVNLLRVTHTTHTCTFVNPPSFTRPSFDPAYIIWSSVLQPVHDVKTQSPIIINYHLGLSSHMYASVCVCEWVRVWHACLIRL